MRIHDDMRTGMLASTPEPFEPKLSICWPSDISPARKAEIQADRNMMDYLAGKPPDEQVRQIRLWQSPAEIARVEKYQAEQKAAREKRDAEMAAIPTHEELCRLFRSLEAKVIEQGVQIATLQEAQPRRPPKVTRLTRTTTTTTPPDAA
jgi:hypothetical protein